jgi:valyl-tRNA synthetase
VRDTQHRKMSKSLGNGIDPMDVVRLYGADALRYTVIAGMGMGADLVLDPDDLEKSFAPGRNFATKLWNIGRFLLTKVGEEPVQSVRDIAHDRLTRADCWILERLNLAIAECDAALGPARPTDGAWLPSQLRAGLRLNEYAESARRFVWNELADWYLESVKARLNEPGADRDVARAVLVHTFDAALRLLHPVVPFITEALWQRLPERGERDAALLCTAAWPVESPAPEGGVDFERVRDAVNALRAMRAEYAVAPGRTIDATIVTTPDSRFYADEAALIGQLARARVTVGTAPDGPAAHTLLPDGSDLALPLGALVDLAQERTKLDAELERVTTHLASIRGRLANAGFTSRAPEHVVAAERAKEAELAARATALEAKRRSFGEA